MQEKYRESVKCIYIDPPYNAQSSEIPYKNSYKHSSWLSLMESRIEYAKKLLGEDSVYITAIDEVENARLALLHEGAFPNYKIDVVSVLHNPTGQQGDNFSFTHEFAHFIYPENKALIGTENREDKLREAKPDIRPLRNVSSGKSHLRESAANCFYPIYVKDGKIAGFGDVSPKDFHPENINIERDDGIIEVYPIDPSNVESKWVFARDTVESILSELTAEYNPKKEQWDIIRKKTDFRYKSMWFDKRYSANSWGSAVLNKILPENPFKYPKSIYTVMDCIDAGMTNQKTGVILDYFAGSGTTGHAVINLNREDGGNRKYILVEMGEYFNTVTKPRIQKVIYSKDWKDGKPTSRDSGISHCFKTLRLESYEDALNNLKLANPEADNIPNKNAREKYLLSYMLDMETKGALFNLDIFENPFDYQMNITAANETTKQNINLIETFNYLIGLKVAHSAAPQQIGVTFKTDEHGRLHAKQDKNAAQKYTYKQIEGVSAAGRTLVIWRNLTKNTLEDNAALNEYLRKIAINPKEQDYDIIYVNGDNNLMNPRAEHDSWKVQMIEQVFFDKMFAGGR